MATATTQDASASAPMRPLAITAFTATCAAGRGRDALAAALAARRSGLRPNDFGEDPLPCWIGRVAGVTLVLLHAGSGTRLRIDLGDATP